MIKKEKGAIDKKFSITIIVLGLLIVVIWVFFFSVIRSMITTHMTDVAQTTSELLIARVDEQLLGIDNAVYSLAHYDKIIDMASAKNYLEFYDLGNITEAMCENIIGLSCPADNCIIYTKDGSYYRLRGQLSNTVIENVFFKISNGNNKSIFVTLNNMAYIGSGSPIMKDDEIVGYIVLLMDMNQLEEIMSEYEDIDYLGIALTVGDSILCSNKNITEKELENAYNNSIFYRMKQIGLTDYNIIVYCEAGLSKEISNYFALVLPVTVLIIILVVFLFAYYWRKHFITPVNSVIEGTMNVEQQMLELTGEKYFDGLVTHVNDMVQRIEDKEKELFDSKLLIKEAELERERNLIILLKKQINAHFTVNTLNAIRALVYKGDKEQAASICEELSCLLRYANAAEEYISLMEEIYVLKQYVSIMQIRYPDSFNFNVTEEDAFEKIFIPRMLIQPVVENAISYGKSEKIFDISMSVRISDNIEITISDNGKGMDEDTLARIQEEIANPENYGNTGISSIALINIARRIKIVCGDEYGIIINSSIGNGTKVTLMLRNLTGLREK